MTKVNYNKLIEEHERRVVKALTKWDTLLEQEALDLLRFYTRGNRVEIVALSNELKHDHLDIKEFEITKRIIKKSYLKFITKREREAKENNEDNNN